MFNWTATIIAAVQLNIKSMEAEGIEPSSKAIPRRLLRAYLFLFLDSWEQQPLWSLGESGFFVSHDALCSLQKRPLTYLV